MKYFFQKTLLLVVLLLSSFTSYAQTDAEVCQWVRQILNTTLSVDYKFKQTDDDELRTNYTTNAWNALTQFLGGYLKIIKEQQLTLHPIFTKEPFIEEKGFTSGIQYWRVDEVVTIPELNLMVAFSLVVIKLNRFKDNQFLIQSMDMIKKED